MQAAVPRRRGRPPAMSPAERRRRIIAGAEETFLSKGYSAANMDDVGRACGMSKKTVYELFATKEQLFDEVISASLEDTPPPALPETGDAGGKAALRTLLRAITAFVLSPRQVALLRLVLAESRSNPELGLVFYDTIVVSWQDRLVRFLPRLCEPCADERRHREEIADLIIGALLGPRYLSALLGRTEPPSEKEIHTRIDWLLDSLAPTLKLEERAPEARSRARRPKGRSDPPEA